QCCPCPCRPSAPCQACGCPGPPPACPPETSPQHRAWPCRAPERLAARTGLPHPPAAAAAAPAHGHACRSPAHGPPAELCAAAARPGNGRQIGGSGSSCCCPTAAAPAATAGPGARCDCLVL
ncbi:hypothetical protein EC988_009986, partial [Linderina pennispora]